MTDTIIVTDAYTVDASTALKFKDQPGFILKMGASEVSLTVGGKVAVATGLDGAAIEGVQAIDVGQASVELLRHSSFKVAAHGTDGQATGFDFAAAVGRLHNAGKLIIQADAAIGIQGQDTELDNVGAIKVKGQDFACAASLSDNAVVRNTGRILVSADGEASAVLVGAGSQVDNLRDIKVIGADQAVGVALSGGGALTNKGLIAVTAEETFGVWLRSGSLDNSGEIHAQTVEGAMQCAIYLDGDLNDPTAVTTIHNTGLIEGSISENLKLKAGGADLLTNEGEISGFIGLGRGEDVLINNGQITGDVNLGENDDVFDGRHGLFTDRVIGSGGDDLIMGGSAGEVLFGDLVGTTGDDTLIGGGGADQLSGDGGADLYAYNAVNDSKVGHGDRIVTLDGLDHIDLSAIDADHTQAGDQAFHLVSDLTGHAGELYVTYDEWTDRTTIGGDIDGDGRADMEIYIDHDARWFTGLIL